MKNEVLPEMLKVLKVQVIFSEISTNVAKSMEANELIIFAIFSIIPYQSKHANSTFNIFVL